MYIRYVYPVWRKSYLKRQKNVKDKTQLKTFSKDHFKIMASIEKGGYGMAPTDIKKKTGLSFATVCTHLQRFIKDGQVKEKNGKYYWNIYYL